MLDGAYIRFAVRWFPESVRLGSSSILIVEKLGRKWVLMNLRITRALDAASPKTIARDPMAIVSVETESQARVPGASLSTEDMLSLIHVRR